MVTDIGVAYVVGVTFLFFFWVYGIYAFVRDLRGRYLPLTRQYLRGRRKRTHGVDGEENEASNRPER